MSVKVRPSARGYEVDIRWRTSDGVFHRDRKRVSITSRSAAQRWGEQREQMLIQQAGRPTTPNKEVPTLRQFAPRFMKEHAIANQLKPSGIAHKEIVLRVHLLPALGGHRVDAITNSDVAQLKYKLREKSAHTVNNVLTVLNTLLKKAIEWAVIDAMPCTVKLLRKPPAMTRVFDFEQYDRVVAIAERRSPSAHVVVLLAGDAGLRAGEIRALHWEDVDFALQQMTIRRSEWHGQITTTKGNKVRFVPMTDRLSSALKLQRHLRGPFVLYRDNGNSMAEHHVEELLRGVLRDAGVRGSPHVFRHTFVTHALMNHPSLRDVQAVSGHQDLKTLERYLHVLPGASQEVIRKLERGRQQRLGEIRETRKRTTVCS